VIQGSVNSAIKSICDVMRRSNCAGALQYVPELTWLLFLQILDEREKREAEEAEAVGAEFTPPLESPYRWQDWADPAGARRRELQKVISEILAGAERVRIDPERNFLDVLDKVHEISDEAIDPTHVFPLLQVYEGLLLKMGEKGNDGGQFFTPREVIRAMVRTVDPGPGRRSTIPAAEPGASSSRRSSTCGGISATPLRRIRQCGRRCEDEPPFLYARKPHREDLVLRPVRREGRKGIAVDHRSFRRVLPPASRAR
jgi:hypothetical protein